MLNEFKKKYIYTQHIEIYKSCLLLLWVFTNAFYTYMWSQKNRAQNRYNDIAELLSKIIISHQIKEEIIVYTEILCFFVI